MKSELLLLADFIFIVANKQTKILNTKKQFRKLKFLIHMVYISTTLVAHVSEGGTDYVQCTDSVIMPIHLHRLINTYVC